MSSEDLLKLINLQTMSEPQIVGNIAMIGLLNETAPEESPVLSLRDALRQKKINIEETSGGYTQLIAKTELPTLIRSSEGMSKAGKQDRVTRESTVVDRERILDVYCIEHGRWGQGANQEWQPVNLPVPIRRAILEGREQHDIWTMINSYLEEWKITSRSDALSAIFDALGRQFEKFVANFEWWENQIGMIVCINGVPSGLELFNSKNMFREDGMHLLRESYVPEALRGDKVPILPGDIPNILTKFFEELKDGKRKTEIVRYKNQVVYATIV